MSDLEQRMQELDHLQPPDLWLSIEVRANRPQTFMQRVLDSLRLVSAMQVAAVAVALAVIIGSGVVASNLGLQKVESTKQPGGSGKEKGGLDEYGGAAQTTEEDAAGSGGRPGPAASPGMQGSSEESRTGGGPAGGKRETAGPPVFHTDPADDAYGPDPPPNAAASQSAFDILRVDWEPVSYVSEDEPGGYSISMTLAGSARADGSYNSFGVFPSDDPRPGEGCQLYHSLIPGTTAFANALCGSTDRGTRRLIGRVQGGPVTSTPTEAGGTRLSATFDNREIPPELQAAERTLHDLSAFTCMQRGGRLDCTWYDTLDNANSTETYRI